MAKKTSYWLFLLSFITAIFFSCKKQNTVVANFTIKMDAIIIKNDSIHTYYTTDGTINFNEKQSFWTQVKGNKKNQEITITFPKSVVPNQFRLDFGNTLLQEDIVLNKLEMNYKNKKTVLKGRKIYELLRVDVNNTFLDKEIGLLIRKDKTNKNGPSLYPNGDYLRVKLEEFTGNMNNN
jgi:hypothetical protein